MGMFDYVWAACPSCGNQIELQSKGGKCSLKDYRLYDAPADVLAYIAGDTVHCGKCDRAWSVAVTASASLVPHVELPNRDDW